MTITKCMCAAVSLLLISTNPANGANRYSPTIANFSWQGMDKIPAYLPYNIEVLDFSYNRIRELEDGTFRNFTKLRILNLRHNALFEIGNYTFYALSKLTELNLNENELDKLPPNLPSNLKRLYLDSNPLIDVFKKPNCCVPGIRELPSLETLSFRDNRLKRFPRFCEHMPNLLELDVSANDFTNLSTSDVAPLCGLKRLHISPQTFSTAEQYCECLTFEMWTRQRNIKVDGFSCRFAEGSSSKVACVTTPPDAAVAIYDRCLDEARTQKLRRILLVGGGVVLLAGAAVLAYALCRWRRRNPPPTDETASPAATNVQRTVTYDNSALEVNVNDSSEPSGHSAPTEVATE